MITHCFPSTVVRNRDNRAKKKNSRGCVNILLLKPKPEMGVNDASSSIRALAGRRDVMIGLVMQTFYIISEIDASPNISH